MLSPNTDTAAGTGASRHISIGRVNGETNEPATTRDGAPVHRFKCAGCGDIALVPDDPVALEEIWAARCKSCGASTTFLPDAASTPLREVAPPTQAPVAAASAPSHRSVGEPPQAPQSGEPRRLKANDAAFSGSWLATPFLVISESWYAARGSKRLLRTYRGARRAHPTLNKSELYKEVIVRWTRHDRQAAATILIRAEQSFDDWSADRSVKFRDVALYLLVDAYLAAHPGRGGARVHMERVVARVIPRDL